MDSTTITSTFLLLLVLSPVADSDQSDESCLTGVFSSLIDPSNNLKNWTVSNFASPCNDFDSYLSGITCNNGRIYKLSLPNMSLQGSLSSSLSNCTSLQSLDLSSNSITGAIPTSISSLLNLAVLNLSRNSLTGVIPPELALCSYLNVIDLHSNKLSGQIPDQIALLPRLSAFDVSNNELEGQIPPLLANRTGTGFNADSFAGNKGLYGYPLQPRTVQGLNVLAIVGIGLASGLLSLLLSFTFVCAWLKATERDRTAAADENKMSQLMPDY